MFEEEPVINPLGTEKIGKVIMPLTTIMLAIGLLIGDGAAAFMSLNLGQGNWEAAARSVGNMISLTIFAGIISLIFFEALLVPFSSLFGATESIMPYALDYGKIIVLGFPFFAVNISFASMIRADGRPSGSKVFYGPGRLRIHFRLWFRVCF